MADYDDMLLEFKIQPKDSDDSSLSKQRVICNYILAFGKTLETKGKLPQGTIDLIVNTMNIYEDDGEIFRWKELEKMLFDHLENYIFYSASHSVLFNDITVGTLNLMRRIYDTVPEKDYLDNGRLNKLIIVAQKLDDMIVYESEKDSKKDKRYADGNIRKGNTEYKRLKEAEKGKIDIDE